VFRRYFSVAAWQAENYSQVGIADALLFVFATESRAARKAGWRQDRRRNQPVSLGNRGLDQHLQGRVMVHGSISTPEGRVPTATAASTMCCYFARVTFRS